MTVYIDFFQLAGITFIGLVLGIVFVMYVVSTFLAWRKSGYCRHDFQLYSTNSSGQRHWYRCTKCKEDRLQ